jgi:hypothetical protein
MVLQPSHPPDALLRVINPVMRWLLRSPLGGPARKQIMVLGFKGRKTGRSYEIPVTAHRIGDDLYALTGATWRLNFRGGADAAVYLDGRTTEMRGELVDNPEEAAPVYARRIAEVGVQRAPRAMGVKVNTPEPPTAEAIVPAARHYRLAAIRLTPKS